MKVDLYFATTEQSYADPPKQIVWLGEEYVDDNKVSRPPNPQWVALAFDMTGLLRFVYEVGVRKKPSLSDIEPVLKYDPDAPPIRQYKVVKAFSPALGNITKAQALAGKTRVLGPVRGDMTENPYAFSAESGVVSL